LLATLYVALSPLVFLSPEKSPILYNSPSLRQSSLEFDVLGAITRRNTANNTSQQPFNAFLSGFSATVGQFVLTASLRIQTNPENKAEFGTISHERAFADYVFGSLLLHFFCVNFIN
jgi:hypothetical protein